LVGEIMKEDTAGSQGEVNRSIDPVGKKRKGSKEEACKVKKKRK
jgi:hypothetical protein